MFATQVAFSESLASPAYADALARDGFVQVENVLSTDSAALLAETLRSGTQWSRSISVQKQGREIPVEQFEAYSPQSQRQFMEMIWSEARDGFQYLFDRYRFWDLATLGHAVPPVYAGVNALLNAPSSIARFRDITGDPAISFLDGQATRYLPGHFLTMHDDGREDAGRRYAYVLNLTERWRGDWGGLLLFHEGERVSAGLLPVYNTLNVFRVPRGHSVSVVAPYAGAPRLSITGWMRSGAPTVPPR